MNRATPGLQEIRFHNPRLEKVGVEVLTFAQLRARIPSQLVAVPQRVDFLHLLVAQQGRADHMVDFVDHALTPGTVLLVRPGQVQRWRAGGTLQGRLALVSGEALAPSVARSDVDMRILALPQWPTVFRPSAGLFKEALAGIVRLQADIERFEGSDVDSAIIRHELLTLLLRLAREARAAGPQAGSSREAAIHALFATELEAGFAGRLTVLDYGKRLGFSESTLSRACVATVGRTAKQEIDRRVALEAARLLVHSRASVAEIGHRLGFTEPTNFVKFFKRGVGCTPAAFRASHLA